MNNNPPFLPAAPQPGGKQPTYAGYGKNVIPKKDGTTYDKYAPNVTKGGKVNLAPDMLKKQKAYDLYHASRGRIKS